ncbi:MAG: hypothetical protein JRI97_13080, partial [Deltaproteobacteria bacterium]|nr:hypothetical protein [Deltaproteobacteria bacterium]
SNQKGSGTYSVAADGAVTMQGFPDDAGQAFVGVLSSSGDLLVLANTDEADDQFVGTMVRAGFSYTARDLSGDYQAVLYGTGDAGATREAFLGSFTFDGRGGFTYSGTSSNSASGASLPMDPAAGAAYYLNSSGMGFLDFGSGDILNVAVLDGGGAAVLAEITSGQEYGVLLKVPPASPPAVDPAAEEASCFAGGWR